MPQKQSELRRRVSFAVQGESRVKQAFKDECDINRIMAKYQKTGLIDHVRENKGNYEDYTNVPESYHEACTQVIAAEEMFMTIPSSIRAKFANDPGQFLAFVEDEKNYDALVEMGLTIKPSTLIPQEAPKEASEAPQAVPSPDGPPTPPRPTSDTP